MTVNERVRVGEGVDGGIVVLGVWCPTCSEDVGPDRDGRCPWCRRLVLDEDALPARQMLEQIRSGTDVREEGSMAVCKVEGCELEAVDRAGMYAKMCETHKAEARAARASTVRPPAARRSGGGSGLADLARKVVPLAGKLERVRARLAELPEQTEAKSEFDEAARRASVSPTPESLERVAETLKQLQTFAPKRARLENEVAQAERAFGLAITSLVQGAKAA